MGSNIWFTIFTSLETSSYLILTWALHPDWVPQSLYPTEKSMQFEGNEKKKKYHEGPVSYIVKLQKLLVLNLDAEELAQNSNLFIAWQGLSLPWCLPQRRNLPIWMDNERRQRVIHYFKNLLCGKALEHSCTQPFHLGVFFEKLGKCRQDAHSVLPNTDGALLKI